MSAVVLEKVWEPTSSHVTDIKNVQEFHGPQMINPTHSADQLTFPLTPTSVVLMKCLNSYWKDCNVI